MLNHGWSIDPVRLPDLTLIVSGVSSGDLDTCVLLLAVAHVFLARLYPDRILVVASFWLTICNILNWEIFRNRIIPCEYSIFMFYSGYLDILSRHN